jgi:hypothetical protein
MPNEPSVVASFIIPLIGGVVPFLTIIGPGLAFGTVSWKACLALPG